MHFSFLSRLLFLSLLLTGVLLTAGCKNEPLKIGVVLPLTGADAEYGQATRDGLEIAFQELQARGEAQDLVLEFHDSTSDPAVARQKVEALFDGRVIAAIAGLSPAEAEAVAPLADELERVILSPTASDQLLSQSHQHFYRLAPSAEMIGTKVASFAAQTLELETMVLIAESPTEARAYGDALQATFERHDGELLGRFASGEDLQPALDAVRQSKPEAVLLAGWGDWIGSTVTALRENGYRGKIFTTESFASPWTLEATGRRARGVMIARTAYSTDGGETVQRFVDAYREQHGEEPGLYAAYGRDALHVLSAALEDRPHLPGEVRSWIRDLPDGQPGVTGHLQFDETGAATKYPRIYSVSKNLELRDHGRWLEEERARIAEEKRVLREKLRKARAELNAAASG